MFTRRAVWMWGALVGLGLLAGGCLPSFTRPALPTEPPGTWRIEPISYSTPQTVPFFHPISQRWECQGSWGRWLVVQVRVTNMRAQESTLQDDDAIFYEHPSGDRSDEWSRYAAEPSDGGMYEGSLYEPDPRFAPRQSKTGFLYYVVASDMIPAEGQKLYGKLLFSGSRFSDAKGQAEVIDLVGLPPGPPPSSAHVQCD